MLKLYRYKISKKYVFDFWKLFQYRFRGLKLSENFIKIKFFFPFLVFFKKYLFSFFNFNKGLSYNKQHLKILEKKLIVKKNLIFMGKKYFFNVIKKYFLELGKLNIFSLKESKHMFLLNFYFKNLNLNKRYLQLYKKLTYKKYYNKLNNNFYFKKVNFMNFKFSKINLKKFNYLSNFNEIFLNLKKWQKNHYLRKLKQKNKKKLRLLLLKRYYFGFNKVLELIKNYILFGGRLNFSIDFFKLPFYNNLFNQNFLKFLNKNLFYFEEFLKKGFYNFKKYFIELNQLLNLNLNYKFMNFNNFILKNNFLNFNGLIYFKKKFLFIKVQNFYEVKPLYFLTWLPLFIKFFNLSDIFRFVLNSLYNLDIIYNKKFLNIFTGTKKDILNTLRIIFLKKMFFSKNKVSWKKGSWLIYKFRSEGHVLVKKYGIRRRRPKNKYYGFGLLEKQKIRFFYGLREKDVISMVFMSLQRFYNLLGNHLLGSFETRISVILCRLNFFKTPKQVYKYILHGYVLVNNITKYNPNFVLSPLDILGLKFNLFFKKRGFLNQFLFKKIPIFYLELDYSLCFSVFKKLPAQKYIKYPFKIRPFFLLSFYSHF